MILVTGAMGFVGSSLISNLLVNNYQVSAFVSEVSCLLPDSVKQIVGLLEDLVVDFPKSKGSFTETESMLEVALENVDVLVHCAARVHIMGDSAADPLTEFRNVNTAGTLNLASQAAAAGVKRFIFISSVKVNGEMTEQGRLFQPDDEYIPDDPYALSKYEAEQGLLAIAKETGMEVVILRPPLVYGPGVKANFASMMKWINKGIPLPFGAINNQRSLVALDNLVNSIIHCIDHPKAANEIFLISDGEDVSTTTLLRKVADAFGRRSWLIPIPVYLLTLAAKLIGKGDVATRLFCSLQVDSSKARDILDWKPVISMDEQLKKTADAYLKNEKNF